MAVGPGRRHRSWWRHEGLQKQRHYETIGETIRFVGFYRVDRSFRWVSEWWCEMAF